MQLNLESDFNELNRRVKEGDQVRFYDSQMAYQKKDHSGTNPKLYPVGRVLRVYARISRYGGVDYLCDIKVQSRVSNAHFVRGVTFAQNQRVKWEFPLLPLKAIN